MTKIFASLLKIQSELKPIVKEEENPHFKSSYYDINAALAQLKPLLTEHGLVLLQPLYSDETGTFLKTIIASAEGEVLEYSLKLPEVTDPQKFGALVTYYRRFALTAFLAIEAEDDDGNTAAAISASKPVHKKVSEAWSGKWEEYALENGKHKGKTLAEINENSPDYLQWLYAERMKGSGQPNPDLDRALIKWNEHQTLEQERILTSEIPF